MIRGLRGVIRGLREQNVYLHEKLRFLGSTSCIFLHIMGNGVWSDWLPKQTQPEIAEISTSYFFTFFSESRKIPWNIQNYTKKGSFLDEFRVNIHFPNKCKRARRACPGLWCARRIHNILRTCPASNARKPATGLCAPPPHPPRLMPSFV